MKTKRRRKYLTADEKEMVEEQQENEERMWSVPRNTNKNVCQLHCYNTLRFFLRLAIERVFFLEQILPHLYFYCDSTLQ